MKEKIIKCAYFVKGFMRMSTMVILLILLVTYYFYQDKIKEISAQAIENNRQNGTLFYIDGIWNKMKDVQKSQDDRNQNAYDLTSATKTVSEKSGLYSFEIPESWDVTVAKGSAVGLVSEIIVSNKSFSKRSEGNDIFYDNGAQLSVQVFMGERFDVKNFDGGHGKMLLGKETVVMGSENVTYHRITDPSLKSGNIIDAHVLHDGNTYEIRYAYNKEKMNGAEFFFQTIMNSFKFNDKNEKKS